jgi:hypothetical protein
MAHKRKTPFINVSLIYICLPSQPPHTPFSQKGQKHCTVVYRLVYCTVHSVAQLYRILKSLVYTAIYQLYFQIVSLLCSFQSAICENYS